MKGDKPLIEIVYKCANRHCRGQVEKPGRCEVCASMWKRTLEIARKAHSQEVADELALPACADETSVL